MTLSNDSQAKKSSLEAYQISLLEEKLQVARRKQKVGEVVIRKQVETRMVHIPIRREKLIVEKTGSNPERLAEVVINEETVNGLKYDELNQNNNLDINQSKFVSLPVAIELLSALAQLPASAQTSVRLEIVTNDSEDKLLLSKVKDICDRN